VADVTALDLVNRVLTFHRFGEVTEFAAPESKAVLITINQAIDKVLNSNDWEFSRRHDGTLGTTGLFAAASDGSELAVMLGASEMTEFANTDPLPPPSPVPLPIAPNPDLFQSPGVARFVSTDSTFVSGETGYPIDSWRFYTVAGFPITQWKLASHHFGTLTTTCNFYTTYTAEYVLPVTVRGLISATKQDGGRLDVEMVSPEFRLEQLSTEPHGNVSDDPRTIYQGGTARATASNSTSNTNDFGLRIIVWPIPETSFKIDYSYWYRYPQLVNPTDEIQGVSDSAIHDVVNWAYAHSNLTGIGNDPKLGAALKADTRFEINETRTSEKAAMSYDGRIAPYGSLPRGHPSSRNPRWRWDSQRIVEP
jgi:hypothetical protein